MQQINKSVISSTNTNFIRSMLHKLLGKYLLATNVITSGALFGIGDIIQQEIEFRRNLLPKRYDYERAGRMVVVGLVQGPFLHYFYKYLDKLLPHKNISSIGKKVVVDQTIASPFCIVTFFYGMGLMEKKTYAECEEELKQKFMTVYTVDWCVWPPTQIINFYYVSPQLRVVYINTLTMLYDVFLSFIKHKDNAVASNVASAI